MPDLNASTAIDNFMLSTTQAQMRTALDLATFFQGKNANLTAIAALTTASFGLSVLEKADAAAIRTLLGLGSLALLNGSFSGASSGDNTGDQDLSSFLTSVAAAAAYQPKNAELTAIAALVTDAFGRGLLTLTDAAGLRAAAVLGSLATLNAAPAGTLTGSALPSGVTSAPGLLSAAGGNFASGAFAVAFNPAAPGALGATTPAAGTFTALTVGSSSGLAKLTAGVLSAAVAGTDYVLPSGNITGNAATVTTNANLTGDVTSTGNASTVVKINGVALSGLATGLLKNTTATGVPSIATPGTDYVTPTGTETLSGKTLTAPVITSPQYTEAAISASDIDWATASHFYKTLAANSTFTFSNLANGKQIVVVLTNTASNYTVTWPTVIWSGGPAPVQTTGAKSDIYTFIRINGIVYGSVIQNF